MKDAVIMNLTLPEVTIEDVFAAEGADYSKRSPRPSLIELHRQILDEAPSLLQPKAIWCEVDIKGYQDHELLLEEGKSLTSPVLCKVAGTADKLALFAVTIGDGIESRISQYQADGELLEAFTLDATATAYLTKTIFMVQNNIEKFYHDQGLRTTFSLGPGHSYWQGLDDLHILFYFLQAEKIGLRLNTSNLIIPRKSVSVVMGVGNNIPDTQGKTHCHYCHLQVNCQLSQAKHREPEHIPN